MFKSTIAALIIFCSTLYAETNKVNVILEANIAPPFWSPNLPFNGLGGEIIHEISKIEDINATIVYKPLSRIIDDDSNNDLGNPAFFIKNQEYQEIIPILIYDIAFYYYEKDHIQLHHTSNSHHEAITLDDLQGKKIGVLKGSNIDRKFFQNIGINFEESYNQESLFKKLKIGRVDYVLEIELVGNQIIDRLFSSVGNDFVSIPIAGESNPIAIMLAYEQKDAALIARKFRHGLEQIIQNGVYQAIFDKYAYGKKLSEEWFYILKMYNMIYNREDK